MVTEMVKEKDILYLSIIRHMLAAVLGDQEEYVGAVGLIVCDGYRLWG